MLVESLIRLGRPFITGGLSPAQILEQVSDINSPSTRNFLSKVILVEIDRCNTGEIAVQWGRCGIFVSDGNGKNDGFQPDVGQAVATPFVIPSGGNPLKPQGKYGVPVYPLYEKHFQTMKEEATNAVAFLTARIERTSSVDIVEEEIEQVGSMLQAVISDIDVAKHEKWLGLLAILPITDSGIFRYEDSDYEPVKGHEVRIGSSQLHPSKNIIADLNQIVECFWESKLAEGEEKGRLRGDNAICSCCGSIGDVVSVYSKAWSWFTTTWPGPLSIFLKNDELVHGVALCPDCYKSLTFGSNLFDKLTTTLPMWLTKEIFAPVDNATSREHRSEATDIFGGILVLPILDSPEQSEEDQSEYVQSLMEMAGGHAGKGGAGSLHLNTITGIEQDLPLHIAEEDLYRLTILYFSGDPSRGDIHLRANVEDVLPSAAQGLTDIVTELFEDSYALQKQLFKESLNERASRTYRSLPAMLSNAYGMTRMWSSLASAMHRKSLPRDLFVRHAALRMQDLSRKVEDKFYLLQHEVFFYLYFQEFLQRYHLWIGEEGGYLMTPWQDLMELLDKRAYRDIDIDGVADLGFAAGYLVRKFSRLYYNNTDQKQFLRDRVITFGSKMSPEVIVEYALKRMIEYAFKLKFDGSFVKDEELLGLILAEYQSQKDEVLRQRDEFMTSFWAGYCLNRGKRKQDGESGDETLIEENGAQLVSE